MKRPSGQTQKHAAHELYVHVDETGVAEEDVIGKRGIARNDVTHSEQGRNRMQRAPLSCLGVPLFMVKRPVDQTQKGTPYGVGVHVQSGGGCE